jgi:hypothetical protein
MLTAGGCTLSTGHPVSFGTAERISGRKSKPPNQAYPPHFVNNGF